MNPFRRDLQQADPGTDADTYRRGLLYNQDDLAEEARKLRKSNKHTHYRLREMASNGALRSIAISTRLSDRTLVELVIFGCKLLLLPGLFPSRVMTIGLSNWIKTELSLLEALKETIEEGRNLSTEEDDFLADLRETNNGNNNNNNNPHGMWIMTLIMSVNTFRNAR